MVPDLSVISCQHLAWQYIKILYYSLLQFTKSRWNTSVNMQCFQQMAGAYMQPSK